MKKLLSALVALALCTGLAMATVPDPTLCIVTPCDNLDGVVVCPDLPGCIPAANVTVTVKNAAGNVIPNASIQVTFGSAAINLCAGSVWTGTANGSGVWTKCFNAGGCFIGANACVITANGVVIRAYNAAKSPDWDGGAGNKILQANDFSNFLAGYVPGTGGCHDYDNNGATDLGDFVIFASGFNPSHSCP